MIRLRTRPKSVVKKFKTYPVVSWEINNTVSDGVCYYEKDGQEFLYLKGLHLIFIPETSNLKVEDILGDTNVDISDWTLTKVSEENPGYTLNQLNLEPYYRDYDRLFQGCEVNGVWVLENKDCNTRFEFYLRTKKDSWDDTFSILLGYPEKTQVPYSRELIHRKGHFLMTLIELWKKKQLGISLEK